MSVEHHDGESRLRVQGAFDAFSIRRIRPALDELAAARPRRVTVDLEDVLLLDSCGVSAIVSLRRLLRTQGGQLVVVHAHDQPLAVLKVLRLDALFDA